jgi:hypothetical protein
VLKQCGDNLTRENVMKQAASLKDLKLPMLLPGITINTSDKDFYPIEQMQMQKFNGERWELFGPVISGRRGKLIQLGRPRAGTGDRGLEVSTAGASPAFSFRACAGSSSARGEDAEPDRGRKQREPRAAAASAAVAAHEIDENASANVAKREAVWRWRKVAPRRLLAEEELDAGGGAAAARMPSAETSAP